jgi:hypothetical protein
MLQVFFSNESRFKQIIDRQQSSSSVFVFFCTKNEISILSTTSSYIVHTELIADGFKHYVHPAKKKNSISSNIEEISSDTVVKFAVNAFELSKKMSNNKENHNNSIMLTLENVEKSKYISLDFINENGEKTIPSTKVELLENKQKYTTELKSPLPDITKASTLTTDSDALARILACEKIFAKFINIKMNSKKVVFEMIGTENGCGNCTAYHTFDDLKGYDEENIFLQRPKYLEDKNIIKINPNHNKIESKEQDAFVISQCFKLANLTIVEKPTTYSNCVVIGMTPNQWLFIRYKITGYGFVTYYINEDNFS